MSKHAEDIKQPLTREQAERLFDDYRLFAFKIVNRFLKFRSSSCGKEDLEQAGMAGLWAATTRFDAHGLGPIDGDAFKSVWMSYAARVIYAHVARQAVHSAPVKFPYNVFSPAQRKSVRPEYVEAAKKTSKRRSAEVGESGMEWHSASRFDLDGELDRRDHVERLIGRAGDRLNRRHLRILAMTFGLWGERPVGNAAVMADVGLKNTQFAILKREAMDILRDAALEEIEEFHAKKPRRTSA